MGLRRALPLLLLAFGITVANGQCDTLAIDNVLTTTTTVCEGETVSMEVFGAFPTAAILQWQVLDAPDWVDIVGENDTTFVLTPSETSSYRCFATCGAESDSTDTVTVTVHALPLVNASADPAGPFCGTANTTFIATGATGFTWSPPDGLNSTTEDTVQCAVSATTTYTVLGLDTATGCTATDSIAIVVSIPPSSTNSGNIAFCASGVNDSITFLFLGDGPWEVTITGPDTIIDITEQTDSSLVIHDPVSGTYQVTILTTETCPNDVANNGPPLTVTIVPEPTTATATATDTVCAVSGIATLSGNIPDDGTGTWSILSGPDMSIAQIDDPNNAATTFDPAMAGDYVVAWTITSGSCTPSEATVTIASVSAPSTANAGTGGSLCMGASFTLQADAPTLGTGLWTILSGPDLGTSQIQTDALPNAVFTPTAAGTYVLQWAVSNPPCEVSTDAISVIVTDPGSGPVVLGLEDGVACNGEYQTLMIMDAVPGTTYTWSSGAWELSPLEGSTVTAHWSHPGSSDPLDTNFALTVSGGCLPPALFPVQLSAAPASCPKGIVYFEPHGLAILDATASYFQWGTLDADFQFLPDSSRTAQTTFVPGLTACDSSVLVVRTSIDGLQCWSTTVSCATPEMLARSCIVDDGAAQRPQVRVFPNPSNGGPVTLETIGDWGDAVNIDVSDLHSRIISRSTHTVVGMSTTTLDTHGFAPGFYLLRAWNTGSDQTIKLVIERP